MPTMPRPRGLQLLVTLSFFWPTCMSLFSWSILRPSLSKRRESLRVVIAPSTTLIVEPFRDFLARNPKGPGFQRDLRPDRVATLLESIQEYRQNASPQVLADFPVPFLNPFNIGKHGSDIYIIDGQHRLEALKLALAQDDKIGGALLSYVLKECADLASLKEHFRDVNTHLPQNEIMILENGIDAFEAVKAYVVARYPKHVSDSKGNSRFPNVNVDELAQYMMGLLQMEQSVAEELLISLGDVDCSEIVSRLEKKNQQVGEKMRWYDRVLYDKATRKGKQGLFLAQEVKQSLAKIPVGSSTSMMVTAATTSKTKGDLLCSCVLCNH